MNNVRVGDIGTTVTGKTPSTKYSEYFDGNIMFVTPVDLKQNYYIDRSERYITDAGLDSIKKNSISGKSVLVGCIGSDLGNIAMVNEKCATNQQINSITNFKSEYSPEYVYYWFTTKKAWLRSIAGNTTTPIINKTDFDNITIQFPDRVEQDKIVSVLSVIDDKIATNNKIIETSEKLMREIYDYWFVQFDFPDENGRPYKSSGGEMIYDETLKRKIPKGWKACNILDVADWVGGAQPPKSTFIYEPRNGYVRFIQNRDYADDNYKTWIPESKSNKTCDRLDIMMDKYGDAGRIRFGLAGAYNVALAKIAIEKENLREYIRGFLSSEAIYQYLYNACMASTRASLNEEILGNLNLAMPSEEILNQYQTIAEQNIQLILTLSDENKQLASLRDWLLPMLMNEQIKVSE